MWFFQPDFEENNLNQVGRALSMELSWKYCAVSDRFLFLRQFRAVNILISYFRIPLNQTNMKKIFTLMLLSGMFLSAQAQTAQEPTAEEKAWMAYMTPGPMHKMLADADGEWTEEMTMWMAPGAEPMKNTATCVNKMILGGRYQESRHSGNFMGMPFEGVSTVAYDNAMKKYLSTWIDNMGTGLMYMEGVYDEATKAVHFKGKMVDPVSGQALDCREIFSFIDNDTQKMEMFQTEQGKERKTMEIVFKRKK